MSDSESENYSSEEDADYEPSDEDYSEDDVNELVKEDNLDEDEQPQKRKSLKKAGNGISSRKRNQEGLCLQRDVGEGDGDQTADSTVEDDLKEKKKADDLWASFLSDVGQKPKPVATTPTSRKEDILVDQGKLSKPQDIVKDSEKPEAAGKVTITKVFDFAGEEVNGSREEARKRPAVDSFAANPERKQGKGQRWIALGTIGPNSFVSTQVCHSVESQTWVTRNSAWAKLSTISTSGIARAIEQ
ncbi:craniofacial development protein 1 isoform X2 [Cetorhinus maximus]